MILSIEFQISKEDLDIFTRDVVSTGYHSKPKTLEEKTAAFRWQLNQIVQNTLTLWKSAEEMH